MLRRPERTTGSGVKRQDAAVARRCGLFPRQLRIRGARYPSNRVPGMPLLREVTNVAAPAIKLREQLHGKKVVGIVSGGNLPLARFASLLA